jgi:hypothetical protein
MKQERWQGMKRSGDCGQEVNEVVLQEGWERTASWRRDERSFDDAASSN